MLLQKQRTVCIKVKGDSGPLSDSTVLDETWALTRVSNKPLYAFALLWASYSLSFGDSDSGHNNHLVRSFFLNMYFKIASFFDSLYYICFIFLASITIGHTSYCFLFASLLHNWILEFLFFRTVHLLHVQCLVFVSIQDKFLKYVKEFLIKDLNI